MAARQSNRRYRHMAQDTGSTVHCTARSMLVTQTSTRIRVPASGRDQIGNLCSIQQRTHVSVYVTPCVAPPLWSCGNAAAFARNNASLLASNQPDMCAAEQCTALACGPLPRPGHTWQSDAYPAHAVLRHTLKTYSQTWTCAHTLRMVGALKRLRVPGPCQAGTHVHPVAPAARLNPLESSCVCSSISEVFGKYLDSTHALCFNAQQLTTSTDSALLSKQCTRLAQIVNGYVAQQPKWYAGTTHH